MTRFIKYSILLTILSISLYIYNNFFTIDMISGTYNTIDYEKSLMVPNFPDKLILNEDFTYRSKFFGNGFFKIDYDYKGTKIYIDSDNGSLSTRLTRNWFGKPKIIIFKDLGHYYEKE